MSVPQLLINHRLKSVSALPWKVRGCGAGLLPNPHPHHAASEPDSLRASTHIVPDSTRTRKLLLNAIEIRKLIGKVEQKGYTLVPLNLHFSKGNVKCEIGLARGKKQHDKRAATKEREWEVQKGRIARGDLNA